MRILFVISGLGLGGAERQTIFTARELVQRGHEVIIYTLTNEVPRQGDLQGSGVTLVCDPKRRKLDLGVLRRLRARIKAFGADVVQGVLYDGNLYARLAGAFTGAVVINAERSDNYRLRPQQRLGYFLTRPLVHALVANSHAGMRFAQRMHRLRDDQLDTVGNSIDLAEVDAVLAAGARPAHELVPGAGLKRVAMVGAIKPPKDHALALQVAHELVGRDGSWHFIFVGDRLSEARDDHKAAVMARHAELGLQGNAHFVGHRRDVLAIIASCDALLVTSQHEGFPNVVLEAMACGTPVVSTDYSDVRRILPQPWQVVPERDPRALAAGLERALAERAEVARVQRGWVERHASVAANVAALEQVYRRHLAGRRGGGAMAPASPASQANRGGLPR
jgi:glycosyltransferase involved in cell wall biosynthesis